MATGLGAFIVPNAPRLLSADVPAFTSLSTTVRALVETRTMSEE